MNLGRRIFRPKESIGGTSLNRSLLDRLADYMTDDLPALYEAQAEGVETPTPEQNNSRTGTTTPDRTTKDSSSTEMIPPRIDMQAEPSVEAALAEEGPSPPTGIAADHSFDLPSEKTGASFQSVHLPESERQASKSTSQIEQELFSSGVIRQKSQELVDQAEQRAGEVLSRSAQRVQEQTDTAFEVLGEKLRVSGQQFIAETERQLSGVARALLDNVTSAATEQARNQLSQMLQEFQANGKTLAEDCEKRQGELSSAIEMISATLQNILPKFTKELADEAEMTVNDLSRSAERLREQADAAVAALGDRLSTSTQRFLEEAEMTVNDLSRSAERLREQADGAVATLGDRLSTSTQRFLDEAENYLPPTAQVSSERSVSRDTEDVDLEFTGEEKQRIEQLAAELRAILSEATRRQSGLTRGQKSFRQSAS